MENKDMLDPKTEQNNTEETPIEVPAQEELDNLQTKVRNLPESKWNLIQYAGGAVLGLFCGYLLTIFGEYESIGMYSTIIAVLIALFVPKMAEKRLKRSVQKGRIALMIALAVWMLAFLLIMILNGTPLVDKPV